jgi:hypothetical protein
MEQIMAAKTAKKVDEDMEAKRLLWDAEWFVSEKMAEKTGRRRGDYTVEIRGDKVLAWDRTEKLFAKLNSEAELAPREFTVQEVVAWKKEMNKPKTIKLGSFEVTSGEVVVSDPCYGEDVWCMGFLKGVANGTWEAEIRTGDEGRVAKLYATLKGAKRGKTWEETAFTVGVDSGQAGIFDKPCYRTHQKENEALISSHWKSIAEREEKDEKGSGVFYAACCSLTCGDDNGATQKAGVLKGGVVSSTGYGDGSYTCYFQKDARGIFTICIQFM